MSTALPTTHEALTVPEVMKALRYSRSRVYDLIRSGVLPSFKEGHLRRVPADALSAYLRAKLLEEIA
ncbi:helix-turn-helix domain-containing protein [Streptomyces orinoci]|uniref:Helix-turn-helix domain-containing protein n=1 Tax=Streptomyces orinoci TaxID=67339 RepID=A0ABV3JPW7_STRON|nr:helix-turn-helix domain-containing protein [Streptomyces orinoci]